VGRQRRKRSRSFRFPNAGAFWVFPRLYSGRVLFAATSNGFCPEAVFGLPSDLSFFSSTRGAAVWQFTAQIVADFEQRDLDAAVSTMMAMPNHGATYLEKTICDRGISSVKKRKKFLWQLPKKSEAAHIPSNRPPISHPRIQWAARLFFPGHWACLNKTKTPHGQPVQPWRFPI